MTGASNAQEGAVATEAGESVVRDSTLTCRHDAVLVTVLDEKRRRDR
jgi:hypothetical protein